VSGSGHQHRPPAGRALVAVLGLTVAFGIVEALAGWLAGSLALLADAGHMATDASSLGIALGALWLARRPPTPARSFGFGRAEILAALLNGLALVAVGAWIVVEAWRRLDDPPDVHAGWMLAVASVGLAVNVVGATVLHRSAADSLNVRAALRHVVADLASSLGTAVAAVVILATGWREADPLVGGLVGVLVVASSWAVLRESLSILLEAAPRGIDVAEVGRAMAAEPLVVEVHDLHIWTITSGFPALSAHVLVTPGADCHGIRRQLEELLRSRFETAHTTLQVDHAVAASSVVELGDVERRRTPLSN
jgi:cobalt-zinc-cadmium efflux system protein